MKYIFITTISLFFSTIAFGQTGVLTGIIVTPDGKPAEHISVSLQGTSSTAHTNQSGRFTLRSDTGNYRLGVYSVGIKSQVFPVAIRENDTTKIPKIVLEKNKQQLQEVVISAQRGSYQTNKASNSLRLTESLQEIPQNIQVVTSAALSDQQVLTLGDGVIHNVAGATKLEHWDSYTRINMRGARASEFLNGMNVTSNWGPLSPDMSIVDRIEFVKGPAGFMISNGDPSGIFNVVTKKPDEETKGEASLLFGSYNLYRADLDLDGNLDKSKKLLYRLDLMGQTQNSFQKYRFTKRYTIHPVLTYKLDDKTDLTAEYIMQYAQMSNVGTPYAFSTKGYGGLPRGFTTLGPGLAPTTIKDQSLFLYLQHRFNDDWTLNVHTAYLHSTQVGSSSWPSYLDSTGNMIRNISMFDALNESEFAQVYLNGNIQTGKIHHRILAALDLGNKENTYDWSQSHALDTKSDPFNIYHPNYGTPANGFPDFDRSKKLSDRPDASRLNQSYSGIYLQDELGFINDKIRLTIAGRYTNIQQSDYGTDYSASKFSPRLGISVSVDKHTAVYALFDQSFLPQSGLLRGNIAPKPLTGNNMEIGIKKNWFHGRWNSTLSVYRILENGKLVSDPDTTDNPDNRYSLQIGQNKTQGIELDIRGEIFRGFDVIVNYAYTDSYISKDIDKGNVGNSIPGFARNVANGWLSYEIQQGALKGLGFSGGSTYQNHRSTWSWGSALQQQLPDYFRLDGGIFWQYKKMKINLTVNNVLNAYLYSGSPYGNFYYWQMEAPRNFRLGIDYRF